MPDRSIARMAKVSPQTVTAVRLDEVGIAQIEQSSHVETSDGRKYPRTRKQPVKRKRKPGKGYADA